MKNKVTTYIVVIIFSFPFYSVQAQECTVSGKVVFDEDASCENCLIHITKEQEIEIIKFNTTDNHGEFTIKDISPGEYSVRIFQFGYRDTIISVSCIEGLPNDLGIIRLNSLSLEMDELTIVDKVMLFKKSGDTTIINTRHLATGTELSSTDIIKNIPGISIENERYKFQGKNIDRVFLDGLDIDDGGHISLTNSIDFSQIKDVRIIENYSEKVFAERDSSKLGLAMDITLKEKGKRKVQRYVRGDVGIKNIYNIEPSLLYTNGSNAIRLQAKTSNSSKPFFEFDIADMIRREKNNIHDGNYYSLVSQSNSGMNLMQQDNNHLSQKGAMFKAIGNFRTSKRGNLKSTNVFSRIRKSYVEISNEYFVTNNYSSSLLDNDNDRVRKLTSINEWEHAFESSKLSFDISFNMLSKLGSSQNERKLKNIKLATIHHSEMKYLEVTPLLVFEHTFRNDWKAVFQSKYQLSSTRNDIKINAPDSLFFGSVYRDDGYEQRQHNNARHAHYIQQGRLTKKLGGLEIVFNSIYENNNDKIELSASEPIQENYKGDDQLLFKSLTSAVHGVFDRRKITLTIGINHNINKMERNDFVSDEGRLSPYFTFVYKVNHNWNLYFNYNEKITKPRLYEITDLFFIDHDQLIKTGLLPINYAPKKRNIQLGLHKSFSASIEKTTALVSFNYSPRFGGYSMNYINSNGYLIEQFQESETRNEIYIQAMYGKYQRNYSFNSILAFLSKSTIFENAQNSSSRLISLRTSGSYKFNKSTKFLGGVTYNLNSTVSPILSSHFHQARAHGGLSYQWRSIVTEIDYVQTSNYSHDFSTFSYNDLNFSVRYKVPKSKTEIFLKGRDLLNINDKRIVNSIFTENYISTNQVNIQEGQLTIGLKMFL